MLKVNFFSKPYVLFEGDAIGRSGYKVIGVARNSSYSKYHHQIYTVVILC